jgi:hypothetical protein
MPDFGVSEIIGLIGALAGATSVGKSIYDSTNAPGTPKPVVPTPAQNATTATNTRKTQEAALSSEFPSLQAQTGGSLSPEAWLQLSQLLSGQAETPGIGGSVEDLLAKLKGGGSTVSAGNANAGGGSSTAGLTPAGAFG